MRKISPVVQSDSVSSTRTRLSAEREEELLKVAAAVFAERGFDGASVGEMAKRANASKGTFYSRFETKEALLLAVVGRQVRGLEDRISVFMRKDLDLRATLTMFATEMLAVALSDEVLSSYRVVTLEAQRFPELGRLYYENGPEKIARYFAEFLKTLTIDGRLAVEHPLIAAEQFIDAIVGMPRLRAALGIGRPSRRETQQRVELAVDGFMKTYGIKSRT